MPRFRVSYELTKRKTFSVLGAKCDFSFSPDGRSLIAIRIRPADK
jgi:hypothetical protein